MLSGISRVIQLAWLHHKLKQIETDLFYERREHGAATKLEEQLHKIGYRIEQLKREDR